MREAYGDLFKARADALIVTTTAIRRRDGRAVMGAGIAKAFAVRYPGLEARLGQLLAVQGNLGHLLHRGCAQPWPCFSSSSRSSCWRALRSYPSNEDWRQPSSLELVERGAGQLVELAEREGCLRLGLPRPGCGFGGLSWDGQVRPLLARLLDDRFWVVERFPRRA